MIFYDSFTDCKSYAGARICFFTMQALKDIKYLFPVPEVYPNAIISDREDHLIASLFGCNMNLWGVLSAELDRIAYEILE